MQALKQERDKALKERDTLGRCLLSLEGDAAEKGTTVEVCARMVALAIKAMLRLPFTSRDDMGTVAADLWCKAQGMTDSQLAEMILCKLNALRNADSRARARAS